VASDSSGHRVGVDFLLTDDMEKRLREAGADDPLLIAIAKSKK